MNKTTESEATLDALIEEARLELGAPPSSAELLAYHQGQLSEADAERIREYLAHHPASVERFLDLTAYPSTAGRGEPDLLSEEQISRDWRKIQRHLESEELGSEADSEPPSRFFRILAAILRPQGQLVPVLAVTASLVIATFAVLLWSLNLKLEGLRVPRPNVQHRVLLQDGRRGGPSEEPPIPLSAESEEFLLIFTIIEPRTFPDYRLEIRRVSEPDSEPLWSRQGFVRRGDDSFDLWFPRDFLPPGEYLFQLYGITEGAREQLATYTVEL